MANKKGIGSIATGKYSTRRALENAVSGLVKKKKNWTEIERETGVSARTAKRAYADWQARQPEKVTPLPKRKPVGVVTRVEPPKPKPEPVTSKPKSGDADYVGGDADAHRKQVNPADITGKSTSALREPDAPGRVVDPPFQTRYAPQPGVVTGAEGGAIRSSLMAGGEPGRIDIGDEPRPRPVPPVPPPPVYEVKGSFEIRWWHVVIVLSAIGLLIYYLNR